MGDSDISPTSAMSPPSSTPGPSKEDIGFDYTIGGTKVIFPVKPYPTQICMMGKIIRGLERKENCLLESPTGSGKTLSLLCSALAWQAGQKEILRKRLREHEELRNLEYQAACTPLVPIVMPTPLVKKELSETVQTEHSYSTSADVNGSNPDVIEVKSDKESDEEYVPSEHDSEDDDDDDEDFLPPKKKFRAPGKKNTNSETGNLAISSAPTVIMTSSSSNKQPGGVFVTQKNNSFNIKTESDDVKMKIKEEEEKEDQGCHVPRIYFGTRTHKQITQIVRELRKTVYKDVRMSILGSREHMCINPIVSTKKDKNEECKNLLKGSRIGCSYYSGTSVSRYERLVTRGGMPQIWDMEDIVTAGKISKTCPYFSSRDISRGADIIFCPYNYLIDPLIREQMDIVVKDEVILLDEAHNIEDSARDAGSTSITQLQVEDIIEELSFLIKEEVKIDEHKTIKLLCTLLLQWIQDKSQFLDSRGFENSGKVWSGKEVVQMFNAINLNPLTFALYKEKYAVLLELDSDSSIDIRDLPKLTSKSITFLRSLFMVLGFLFDPTEKYMDDYRIAMSRTATRKQRPVSASGGWRSSRNSEKVWTITVNLWCLNPAVVFSELGNKTRCIILSSGTLSPMDSFSSELGVDFPVRLEANHVIPKSQTWVSALSVGPSGNPLNASYKTSETFEFKDDVGKLVLSASEMIPGGVLCFFPSYKLLEHVSERWEQTGMWNQIFNKKIIVSESRSADKHEFDDMLQQYYEGCKLANPENRGRCSQDGALMLAVCRGKVSEGLDFSDENARLVITVGIPFPNYRDIQVEQKRKYNDMHHQSRGLLSGHRWYEIQAFRALNQALGRCIRHRRDWGAMLMVDERFIKTSRYINSLSKWIRPRVTSYNNYQTCLVSLMDFASERKENPCPTEPMTPIKGTPNSSISSQLSQSPIIPTAANTCIDMTTPVKNISPVKSLLSKTPVHLNVELESNISSSSSRPMIFKPGSIITPKITPITGSNEITNTPTSTQIIECQTDTSTPNLKRGRFVYPNQCADAICSTNAANVIGAVKIVDSIEIVNTQPKTTKQDLTIPTSIETCENKSTPEIAVEENDVSIVDQESVSESGTTRRRSARQNRTQSPELKRDSMPRARDNRRNSKNRIHCAAGKSNDDAENNTNEVTYSCKLCGNTIIKVQEHFAITLNHKELNGALPSQIQSLSKTFLRVEFHNLDGIRFYSKPNNAGQNIESLLNAVLDAENSIVYSPIACARCHGDVSILGFRSYHLEGSKPMEIENLKNTWMLMDQLKSTK